MKKEYIITRQGKEFVLYAGLLDEAHRQGLKRISTTLIQIPHQDNGHMAVVQAEVETEKGTFSGIGDGSPGNISRERVHELIRVAEDRAKARGLRDAVNVGMVSIDEANYLDEHSDASGGLSTTVTGEGIDEHRPNLPKASPYKPASANQLATIAKLSRLLGQPEEPSDEMTSADASERITELSREYNERKGVTGRRSA